jgi:excisionase family DNA binding protein
MPPADLLSPPAPAIAPLLMSELDASRVMGITPRTLYTLRQRAGLPFVRIGARILYRPADLSAWIEQRTEQQVAR